MTKKNFCIGEKRGSFAGSSKSRSCQRQLEPGRILPNQIKKNISINILGISDKSKRTFQLIFGIILTNLETVNTSLNQTETSFQTKLKNIIFKILSILDKSKKIFSKNTKKFSEKSYGWFQKRKIIMKISDANDQSQMWNKSI